MKTYLSSLLALLLLFSCQSPETDGSESGLSVFTGEESAVREANRMFDAIGGKEAWAALRALYVKAIHEQPNLEQPYQSEIWRDMEDFRIRIEQQSPEFHRRAFFNEEGGWIEYVDQDSARQLSPEAADGWRYGNAHNVYVLLHRLAQAGRYKVRQTTEGRLQFYQDTTFLCAFETDDQGRPAIFITHSMEGEEQVTHFTRFDTTEGLVHSAAGGPADGSFTYQTKEWIPSAKPLEEAFEGVGFKYQ